MVFGLNFFLSEDKVEVFKILCNVADIIPAFWGVASLFFLCMSIIPNCVNRRQLEAKTIRNCYFDIDDKALVDKNKESLPTKPLKFDWWDKFSIYYRRFVLMCCRHYDKDYQYYSKGQLTYLRAYDHFRNELNLYQLLQTVHKLKASVQVLLDEDMDKLYQVKKLYF